MANLLRDERVMIAPVAPPHIAVSIRSPAEVVRERLQTNEAAAFLEIRVEEVKNEMVPREIGSGIIFFPREEHHEWFKAVLGELEDFGSSGFAAE